MPDDDLHRLVAVLRRALTAVDGRRLVILTGAGMSVPEVPGVAFLTQMALEFSDREGRSPARTEINEPLMSATGTQQRRIAKYREAFAFVRHVRGTQGVATFLQNVAMHKVEAEVRPAITDLPLPAEEFLGLGQSHLERWNLTEGLDLLAKALMRYGNRVSKILLTTTFDPLLGIALRRAGLTVAPPLAVDWEDDTTELPYDATDWTVVHLHGDCIEQTLHNPAKLDQPNPDLEAWVAEQIRGNQVLVLGYSGWDGLLERVLRKSFNGTNAKADQGVDIHWAVFETPEEHPRVDPNLAQFFDTYSMRGVTPYYGIERDRLLRTLTEELNGPGGNRFFQVARLLSRDYNFGLSHIRADTAPALVFWPHRLRKPHLIHGVHALTAALFSKLGIPIELHLEDSHLNQYYADRTTGDFVEAVNEWFAVCGASPVPEVFQLRHLLERLGPAASAERLWNLANELYSTTNSAFDALVATKVVTADPEEIAIVPSEAHRLLRPLYTWLALEDALERRRQPGQGPPAVVTLGGADERKMWNLWRSRPDAPEIASVFVPRLRSPSESGSLWQYSELNRDTEFAGEDLERFLLRSANRGATEGAVLEWVYTAAVRLVGFVQAAEPHRARAPGSPREPWRDLPTRPPDELSADIAGAVAEWFFDRRGMR